ncbi:hypothetical protein GCM10009541_35250 [Micromonospora gifhornensis]|uniref:SseB protein N-terminal domain-containing protein n=1 Tax=Micromonospora gifhornensis TaxID=84594 RepID=A0ABQ4IJN2_9ACTN|nr:type VII secretion system-associated protein [Micromonospora gifhornensis]GIJ18113.1 hypothetical protein Vgi01_47970 [Micromonospora gifhornensis]
MKGQTQVPEEIRQRARQVPGTWIYAIDPRFDADGAVPPYAIAGAWEVDEHGAVVGFQGNPHFRPPAEPTDPVDLAMQTAATGRGSGADLFDTLIVSTVYLPVGLDGELVAYQDANGEYVAVFTDPRQATATVAQLLPVEFADLVRQLPPNTALWLNPNTDVSLVASSSDLLAAMEARADPAADGDVPAIPGKGA